MNSNMRNKDYKIRFMSKIQVDKAKTNVFKEKGIK